MEKEIARQRELLEKLVLFPGSVEEYERFTIYPISIVDTGRADKGICPFYSEEERELAISLINEKDVEALVNVSFKTHSAGVQYPNCAYGLPVRRKKISSVDDHTNDLP